MFLVCILRHGPKFIEIFAFSIEKSSRKRAERFHEENIYILEFLGLNHRRNCAMYYQTLNPWPVHIQNIAKELCDSLDYVRGSQRQKHMFGFSNNWSNLCTVSIYWTRLDWFDWLTSYVSDAYAYTQVYATHAHALVIYGFSLKTEHFEIVCGT